MNLVETIKEDCRLWEDLHNDGMMGDSYMYLNECKTSEETGLYQLILNGCELWYGTLQEINAIVKSMINRIVNRDFCESGGWLNVN